VVGTGLELLGMNYNCGPLSHLAPINSMSTSEIESVDFDEFSFIPFSSTNTITCSSKQFASQPSQFDSSRHLLPEFDGCSPEP
jgi:hypothetical protein